MKFDERETSLSELPLFATLHQLLVVFFAESCGYRLFRGIEQTRRRRGQLRLNQEPDVAFVFADGVNAA